LFSPTLLSVSLTFCRSLRLLVHQLPGSPSAEFRAVPVVVPHCCGRRQRSGTGDVAPMSPAQVQKTSAFAVLQPRCLRTRTAQASRLVVRTSFGLTLNARLSSRSWGFSPPACAFGSIRCCTSPIDRLLHREGSPRRTAGCQAGFCRLPSRILQVARQDNVASFAVRFKGCSPQRARGRERLSHRWLDSHLSWGSRSPGLHVVHLACTL